MLSLIEGFGIHSGVLSSPFLALRVAYVIYSNSFFGKQWISW